jgi:hypothetical protein
MNWTRRDLLKSTLAASAAAAGQGNAAAQSQPAAAQRADAQPAGQPAAAPAGGRERLLLDFGWRFHFGHANDPAQDFNYGAGGETFAKSGSVISASRGSADISHANFDDSAWQKVDLPHDWAVELPFENDRSLVAHGCHPLGRSIPPRPSAGIAASSICRPPIWAAAWRSNSMASTAIPSSSSTATTWAGVSAATPRSLRHHRSRQLWLAERAAGARRRHAR